ncbi:hypothetical protein [Bosea sp. (in: a-proteobacteria)]|uniref:hypothetical protein n=1 Tax=Bosea sp. (in: a-proteobacteria) TaxID=1871050 RepID=UPI0027371F05|nr:hypothetical protein [Bosea sp. (in: a-proteobacteria)]MDP3410253.1 hypothetical protein [Bosea sp. (in: a-proteobacteria)]
MFRHFAATSLASLAIGAAVFAAASLTTVSPAKAFGGRYERGYYGPPAHGWRPPPPVVHGYWGERRWRRWHEERQFHGAPPPRYGYGYGHGWR